MKRIDVYVIAGDDKTYCLTLAALAGEKLKDGTIITTNDDVDMFFDCAGKWEYVEFHSEITGEAEELIEAALWTSDPLRGFVKLESRNHAALASQVVSEWSFLDGLNKPLEITFDGFQSLPLSVRRVVGREITTACYSGVGSHSAFTKLSASK